MNTRHELKRFPLAITLLAACALAACGGGGGKAAPPADNPALSISKVLTSQSDTPAIIGTILQYTVTAQNTGNVALNNVTVNDPLTTPANQACATLAVNASCTLTGSHTVTAADETAGQVQNTATADSDETATVTSNTVTVSVASNNPALSVSKVLTSQSDNPAIVGTVLQYTVTAQNTGNVTLNNVTVDDPLITPTNETCGTLATSASCTLTGSYTVTAADETAGQVQNTATADSDETTTATSNTVTVTVDAAQPALSVSKSLTSQSDNPAILGTVLQYTVTAQNTGNVMLNNVTVDDPLITPDNQTCGTLAVNASCTLTGSYTVTAADRAAGQVQNTASADSDETTSVNSNTVTVTVNTATNPDLSVSKSLTSQSDTPAVIGTVLQYTVTAQNTGDVTLTNVTVDDPLITPANETCGTLAINASCTLTGSYTVTAGDETAGQVQNTASADSDETATVNSNTVTVSVASNNPALSVSKVLTSQSDTPAVVGTVLQYTVTAQNTGNTLLNNVTVDDPMITPANETCGTLATNASCTLTGSYTVTAADETAGQVENTASADSDETATVNSNTVTVSVNSNVVGLDSRPSNTTCLAPDKPSAGANYRLERVFDGIFFQEPLYMGQPPGDSSRWFVAQKGGRILSFDNTPGVSASTTVLDITISNPPSEGGLLGFAFAPDFSTSGEAYVSYTRNVSLPGVVLQSVISRFTSADGGLTLNPASEQEILVINHPFSNHNGGGIHFGPDGYLYLGMGDGGSISDPQNNGQTTTNLLGTFIRIDVSGGGTGYTIPSGANGNPFAGNPQCTLGSGSQPCPEIFAWGLRNPFRWSFDRDTGDLWAGDVGNLLREEVSLIERGGNYGWVTKEGFACLDPNNNEGELPSCDDAGMIDPIVDYPSGSAPGDLGRTVIGGYVYRGSDLSELVGSYVFGDSYSTHIWTLEDDGNGNVSMVDLIPNTGLFIVAFAESVSGELFVVSIGGSLWQIVEDSSSGNNTVPDLLSQTGCVDPADPTQPASGLIPYTPSAPFWSDNATKPRWLAIPDGTSITVNGDDDFVFPEGSVLVKNFERGGELIETRLLMNHTNGGGWAGYTYRWNAAETEATRVVGGATLPAGGSDWIYPSESQCLECHTTATNRVLGPEIPQLNNSITYPQTGRTANQLATLDAIGMLSPPLADVPANLPSLPDPFGSAPLDERARAYLHTNCSGCHRPNTPLQSTMDLRYDTLLANTNACDADSITGGNLGIPNAKLIAPGDADRSLVKVRMGLRDANGMPPLGSLIVDTAGEALIEQWINSLTDCT